jgi:hypothetical protein
MVSDPSDTAAIDQAINRILAAERDARAGVAQCAAEAEASLAAAQARAERVRVRTEQRVQLVHRIADRCLDLVLADLAAIPIDPDEDGAATPVPTGPPDVAMDEAIARLLDEMVGPAP